MDRWRTGLGFVVDYRANFSCSAGGSHQPGKHRIYSTDLFLAGFNVC